MGENNPFYGHTHTDEYKQMVSEKLTGRVFSEESIIKMAKAKEGKYDGDKNPFYGKHFTEESIRKMLKNRPHQLPNKTELELLNILNPFGFKYVGDGQLIINGKCPDFWNGDHKLIELYGDYWHAGDDPQERIDFFAKEGYNTKVIWEHELKDAERIKEEVDNFIKK